MWFVESLERPVYAAIAARRAAGEDGCSGDDVFSLLLEARYEDGEPMSDQELRDELITLVLAGHETTAHSLAWAFERLLRTPHAYERLREEVRDEASGDDYIEATIHEAMRTPARDPDRRAARARAVAARSLPAAGAAARSSSASCCCTTAATSTRGPPSSSPSASSASSPAPTPGSRSAAAFAAAWGRRSRWPSSAWCCARSRAGPTSRPSIRPPNARVTATSR